VAKYIPSLIVKQNNYIKQVLIIYPAAELRGIYTYKDFFSLFELPLYLRRSLAKSLCPLPRPLAARISAKAKAMYSILDAGYYA